MEIWSTGNSVVYVDVTFVLVFSWDIDYCFSCGNKWDVCDKGDTVLCPVRAWASIVRYILSYPGTTADPHVNTIFVDNKLSTISSATML